ncbi:MAG TPA: VOC family protein [Bacteroidales bacterium]|nr:VOC family protein [Bacteroidales bacterium]
MGYIISGIQQMGIGVMNVKEAWNWYIDQFGLDCRILEDKADAKLMLPYTGGQPRPKHAVLALNLQGGGGFEIWQHTGRVPLMIKEEVMVGDLGIVACKIKVKSLQETLSLYKKQGISILSEPSPDPSGKMTFFIKDPFGNIFQLAEATDWFSEEKKPTGGASGAIIGVTDIEKSRIIYSEILGYDEVIYDTTGNFSDLSGLPGGDKEFRRVLLKRSLPFSGPFCKMFGESCIELISIKGKPGKKIFENRFWGDPGFIHLSYDMQGMDDLRDFCQSKGFPFTVDSKKSHEGGSFDMGEAAGHFSYIEDPDGTLIEFVETLKVPILKKFGLYLDLKKRKPGKSLPDWMLKALKYSRVKKQ